MTDPFELLSALDAPRPLPADLRSRLEDALLTGQQPRPLDAELAERLSGRMTDPVEALLSDLDAPRPLSHALRADVLRRLPPRHAAVRRPAAWIAAAAVSAAAAVAVVLVVGDRPDSGTVTAAGPASTPSASPSSAPPVPGSVSAGTGSVGQAPPVLPAAPPPVAAGGPAAAPAPAIAGGSTGAQVNSVSPDAGPLHGGTPVRLRGPGLATARRVLFGDRVGTQLRHHQDGSISVVTPAVSSPRDVAVVVVLKDGSRVSRSNAFAYVAPPHVDSITPTNGPSAGGTWVVLTGASLSRATSVIFGSTRATRIEPVSDTQVRAFSPAHAPGPVDVVVTTPGGTSAPVRFLYLP